MYKQDNRIYVALLIAYAFTLYAFDGVLQDAITAFLFLYLLFFSYIIEKMGIDLENMYHKTNALLLEKNENISKELEATKAELEQYKHHQSET
jgi:hypothetical protein